MTLGFDYVRTRDWCAEPWANGGGTTNVIASWFDAGGALAARVSVATIDRAGPFSSFPGHDRWLAVLDDGGGLELEHRGASSCLVTDECLAFSGDEPVVASPCRPAKVWNLIVRRGVAWRARVITEPDVFEAQPGVTVIFPMHQRIRVETGLGGGADIPPHWTVLVKESKPTSVGIKSGPGRPTIVAHLDLAPTATVAAITMGDSGDQPT